MTSFMNGSSWEKVSKKAPCTYCGKSGWCSVATDGGIAVCRRHNNGSAEAKRDIRGQEYFVYHLKPGSQLSNYQKIEAEPKQEYPLGSIELRHRAYTLLLDTLELSPGHYANLMRRGLSPEEINQGGYRSLPREGRKKIAEKVFAAVGDQLLQVPGFYSEGKVHRSKINICGFDGLLIPVRNLENKIVSVRVRSDSADKYTRYSSLSSRSERGPGAPAALHYPVRKEASETFLITEGELKAHVTSILMNVQTCSLPGVGTWRLAVQDVEVLRPKRIVIAFDKDYLTNGHVAQPLALLAAQLMSSETELQMLQWTGDFKGIDDALVGGTTLSYLSREELIPHLSKVLNDLSLPPVDWCNPSQNSGGTNNTEADSKADDAWADPILLPDPLPNAPSLPMELIPTPFRPWIADIADRMQVPYEYIAVPAFVAASIAIGRQITIRPKQYDNWTIVPNLWGAAVGRPSTLKSPAQEEALKPLKKIAAEHLEQNDDRMLTWRVTESMIIGQQRGIQEKIKSLAKKDPYSPEIETHRERLHELEERLEQERPRVRRFYTSDGTTEKLGELLRDSPNGILVLRDELYGFLKSNDKAGREGDRAFYLEAWNGYGSFVQDRVARGTVVIPGVCISIFGGIQPSRLAKYVGDAVSEGASDDGLIQRFQLMVWPEQSKEWKNVDRFPDTQAYDRVEQIFRKLTELQWELFGAVKDDGADSIPWLRFTPAAQELFNEWLRELELKLRSNSNDAAIDSHLGKYRKLMPSLALIFYLIECSQQFPSEPGISLEAARLAAAWCEFLEKHARKIFKLGEKLPVLAAGELLKKIKKGKVKDGDSFRDIYRHHWIKLDTEDAVDDAVVILEQFNWVRRIEIKETGGAPSSILRLHPSLRRANRRGK